MTSPLNLLGYPRHTGLCSPTKIIPSSSYLRQVCGHEHATELCLNPLVAAGSFSVAILFFLVSLLFFILLIIGWSFALNYLIRKFHRFFFPSGIWIIYLDPLHKEMKGKQCLEVVNGSVIQGLSYGS